MKFVKEEKKNEMRCYMERRATINSNTYNSTKHNII